MTTRATNPFVDIDVRTPLDLPASDRFGAAGHSWTQQEVDALILAYAARRPLLVRGEAGSGKSQIARAAAHVLGGHQPIVEVIHPRFEALDLLWRLDAVERLADAQIQQLDRSNGRYVKRGRLWEAIEKANRESVRPVLLIDEIDKADAELPNALLDVLGNRSFHVPPLSIDVRTEADRFPLVIVTTNEERELPSAFVRRCAVLNLNPPSEPEAFTTWLVERGRVHRQLQIDLDVGRRAARQVLEDRQAAISAGYASVGLAEYLDLLAALHDLTREEPEGARAAEQQRWLDRLSAYALVKHAGQPQTRRPASDLAL